MVTFSRAGWRFLGVAGVVALALFLEARFEVSALLSSGRVEARLAAAGPLAPAVFVLVMALAIVFPVTTLPLDVLAGRVFGPVLGTLYAVTGATLGSMASFLVARWLGGDIIARFFKGHIQFCCECSDKLLTKIVFLARLLPVVSFDIVSYGAGLTRMSALKFGLASFLGMLPLTYVIVSFGEWIFVNRTAAWIGGGVAVALLFLLPRWVERYDPFGIKRLFEHGDAGVRTEDPLKE